MGLIQIRKHKYNKIKTLMFSLLVVVLGSGCSDKAVEDGSADYVIRDLKTNYNSYPLCVEGTPVFSWKMDSSQNAKLQTAYRIVLSDTLDEHAKESYVWDSGKVESDISVAVPYTGEALESGNDYFWQVYVWDEDGSCVISEDTACFETGLSQIQWQSARWIGMPSEVSERDNNVAGYEDTRYILEYDVSFRGAKTGFVWGADQNNYGRFLRCDLEAVDNDVKVTVSELYRQTVKNENHIILSEIKSYHGIGFGDAGRFMASPHHVRIEVNDEIIAVFLDEVKVLDYVAQDSNNVGQLGLWTTRGANYAYYDNITIKSYDTGEIILLENFDDVHNNIFTPYYVKLSEGWCESDSGYIFTDEACCPAPMFRKKFQLDEAKRVKAARLYATAFGTYDIYLNGQDISDEYMAPGCSNYDKETYYCAYDVTSFVNNGENAIGVMLGHGRYDRANVDWGEQLAFSGRLVITYEDDSRQEICTDHTWLCSDEGPVRNDDLYCGEYYDANCEQTGWTQAVFDDVGWYESQELPEYDSIKRVASMEIPVVCIDERKPVSIATNTKNTLRYDFGQNFNGNCEITFKNTQKHKGQVVTIRYAETLNEENMLCRDDEIGKIWTQNLYNADNTDYYVLSGAGEETYKPRFVYRGFRYMQVSTPVDISMESNEVKALVISSDNERTGYFNCSDKDVNRLYDSIYWTQISNYVDIPTDCPQRDERFGWTGDAQVFASTADFNADVYKFTDRYLDMLRAKQDDKGAYPELVPIVRKAADSNGWSDAGIILTWEAYQQYGNKDIIVENYEAMCKYIDYLVDTSDDFIRKTQSHSDHNAVSGLDKEICNTAQCAYVALLMSKMSVAVGKTQETEKYMEIYNSYKQAWTDKYINEDGSIDCWLQSAYALGLAYEIYPQELREKGAACLNTAIVANDYHLNTGYVATPHILPLLCKFGYVDTAYRVLMQDTYPSWNHMLSHNNTTLLESWFTYHENSDGTYSINGSLNHFALGSVGNWIYTYMLGIKRDEQSPAYKHFYLEPVIGGGLEYAQGSYECMYGTIESKWYVQGQEIVFKFTIPPNTSATVTLPSPEYRNMELGSGRYEYRITLQ